MLSPDWHRPHGKRPSKAVARGGPQPKESLLTLYDEISHVRRLTDGLGQLTVGADPKI
jgi:hypothetical protein